MLARRWFGSAGQRSCLRAELRATADYVDAEQGALGAGMGLWSRCDGDFHRTRAEEARERQRSATAFMRTYYRRVSNRRFARAWGMLHRRVRRQIGPFDQWKAGHRRSLGVSVCPHARGSLRQSSACPGDPAIATRVMDRSCARTSGALGPSLPAGTPGWPCVYGCARRLVSARASRSPNPYGLDSDGDGLGCEN
jgi:hypothetical protein